MERAWGSVAAEWGFTQMNWRFGKLLGPDSYSGQKKGDIFSRGRKISAQFGDCCSVMKRNCLIHLQLETGDQREGSWVLREGTSLRETQDQSLIKISITRKISFNNSLAYKDLQLVPPLTLSQS